jgi:hypothetical protein
LSESPDAVSLENRLQTILENERALSKRLLWLFMLPFGVTAAIVGMFFVLNARLAEVELGTKIVTLERLIENDKNNVSAIQQYELIAERRPSAPVLVRLAMLYFSNGSENTNDTNTKTAIQKLEIARQMIQDIGRPMGAWPIFILRYTT